MYKYYLPLMAIMKYLLVEYMYSCYSSMNFPDSYCNSKRFNPSEEDSWNLSVYYYFGDKRQTFTY